MRPDHIVLARLLDAPQPYAGEFARLPVEVLAMKPIERLRVEFGPECLAAGETPPELKVLTDIFTTPTQAIGFRRGAVVMASGHLATEPVAGLHGATVVPWGTQCDN